MDIIFDFLSANANGIMQKSAEWKNAKRKTIGGSEIEKFMKLGGFGGGLGELFVSKTDQTHWITSIQMNWGNLFEDVIKMYEESIHSTEIVGENAFIIGPDGYISYSPDGLGTIDSSIVLFEFKCPYSRIPTGSPPKYYVPQVKTGLEIIPICAYGLLVESVFRRCSWDQMGYNPLYELSLVPKSIGYMPLAMSVIGFWTDLSKIPDAYCEKYTRMMDSYKREYSIGNRANDFAINDLGLSSKQLLDYILDCFNLGIIRVWYGKIITSTKDSECKSLLNDEMNTFKIMCIAADNVDILYDLPVVSTDVTADATAVDDSVNSIIVDTAIDSNTVDNIIDVDDCVDAAIDDTTDDVADVDDTTGSDTVDSNTTDDVDTAVNAVSVGTDNRLAAGNIVCHGILPWKLFHVRRHKIERTPGYLDPWKEKIKEFLDDVNQCQQADAMERNAYMSKYTVREYTIID